MMTEERTALSRWQIPDRPPRRRERSRWRRPPELLLIVGITLVVLGLLVTVGPLAFDLGGTESPPPDADGSTGVGDSDANGDRTSGPEETDDADGIREAIDGVISGDDDLARTADGEIREECFVE